MLTIVLYSIVWHPSWSLIIYFVFDKAGIIEEMMEDTFEGLEDQDDLEEETQEEVDKILFELTAGKHSLISDIYSYMSIVYVHCINNS